MSAEARIVSVSEFFPKIALTASLALKSADSRPRTESIFLGDALFFVLISLQK